MDWNDDVIVVIDVLDLLGIDLVLVYVCEILVVGDSLFYMFVNDFVVGVVEVFLLISILFEDEVSLIYGLVYVCVV